MLTLRKCPKCWEGLFSPGIFHWSPSCLLDVSLPHTGCSFWMLFLLFRLQNWVNSCELVAFVHKSAASLLSFENTMVLKKIIENCSLQPCVWQIAFVALVSSKQTFEKRCIEKPCKLVRCGFQPPARAPRNCLATRTAPFTSRSKIWVLDRYQSWRAGA